MALSDSLVYTFEKEIRNWGDFMPPYQFNFRGVDNMPGSSFYSSYHCYFGPAFIDRDPNFHTEEEYLCFMGYDMLDPWGSFDAEVEIWIGQELDKMERHIITEPTILRIPPYYWHCPLEYKRVTKPVMFQLLWLRGRGGYYYPRQRENGEWFISYVDTGFIKEKNCIMNPGKKCTLCGTCFKLGLILPEGTPKDCAESMERYKTCPFKAVDPYQYPPLQNSEL